MSQNLMSVKKFLEQEFICDSLNGRMEYEFSYKNNILYLKILADGENIIEEKLINEDYIINLLEEYKKRSIETNLNSKEELIKLLSITDKKLSRSLIKNISFNKFTCSENLIFLYNLRLQAEGYAM